MDILQSLLKHARNADILGGFIFGIAAVYALSRGTYSTILAGIAFALMVYGALPRQLALACLVGASVILLLQTRSTEGFESGGSGSGPGAAEPTPAEHSPKATEEEHREEKKEGFSASNRPMLPDNADRREPLVLGKPYRLPNESDDKGYHLDAGTTFLNAYKALKPDQIAAMTRDTQELLATQKSLVSMLDSFGPLLKDMNKITGMFGQ